ncbi:calcium/sodium antiporter [Methanobacterium petrolearium]|uniref:calcium/sodium antiporter n=1 Tax=Methanobacterium petrolearium TaxID=710190 RepID=UPI001AE53523|nr:calcium/sodium antiporter [Methanobacterium petrolearium]MBP1945804.1 cation:H+ antiporter [Methanobacterium petrolearium]BDZ69650.1 cation transporter [Methanobacterium petrolearium]
MFELFILILALIISLIIVIKAADVFVDSIVEIGLTLGISEIILGVTASAVGTSLPEFGSAMIAILTGSPDVGVGCAIGANIWNIAGILGVSAIFAGLITTKMQEVRRDGSMAFLTTLTITTALLLMGEISFVVGVILIIMYVVYLWILIRAQKSSKDREIECCEVDEKNKDLNKKTILMAVLGLVGLAIGCRAIVYCTVELSVMASIPEVLAGILLAFGTTAPEFFTVLTSAKKGLNSLAIGTVFGSNIFNILIGLGIPSLFVTIPVEPITIYFDAPVMVFMTLLLLFLIKRGMKLTRVEGIILVASYIIYIVTRLTIFS